MAKDSKKHQSRFLWLTVILLSAAIVYLVFRNISNSKEALINDAQKVELSEIEKSLTGLRGFWKAEIKELENTAKGLEEGSESFRLTELLISTFNNFLLEVGDLENHIPNITDTLSFQFAQNEISDLNRGLEGSKSLINEHRKLLNTFSLMTTYQTRIDSLKGVLGNDKQKLQLSQVQLTNLKKEIKDYEEKLVQLKTNGAELQLKNDSLIALNTHQASIIDSLTNALMQQRLAYDDLVKQAKKNADFATRLSLWYFERDNKDKPRRRQLSNKKDDFNKSSELKAIYGEFTISAEVYEPFQVAAVTLFSKGLEIANVQVSVRDQKSGEFVLIPEDKLDKGEYNVKVKYQGAFILSHNFYVSK